MTATDELRKLLDERDVEHSDFSSAYRLSTRWQDSSRRVIEHQLRKDADIGDMGIVRNLTHEQAVAATLGRPKAKAHPYGYEPDTGAFDVTRCECGCLNDISATYCNDCGGEIEIDMNAEKEIYHCPRHLVFAEKHDDGSLEFDEKRYIVATLGTGTCKVESSYAIEFDTLISPDYFEFEMSCGYRFRWSDNEPPDYCPGCGRKVVHGGS